MPERERPPPRVGDERAANEVSGGTIEVEAVQIVDEGATTGPPPT